MPVIGNPSSGGKKPTTPTIGTATDGGTGTTVSVPFTPSTYIGKGSITYTAVSNPGSISATGAGSPITVSGLTTGTAYTFTVKGDTNYGVASDFSAASNSITPIIPSAFESIASATGTGSSGTITFSSIPSTYRDLQIRMTTLGSGTSDVIALKFNGDSGSNYLRQNLSGASNSVVVTSQISQTFISCGPYNGNSNTIPFSAIIDIHNYASTSQNKTVRIFEGINLNNNAGNVTVGDGCWTNTSAITSLTLNLLSTNFTTTSTFALYGIKGA